MIIKVIVATVVTAAVFAEHPLLRTQQQEEPYQPSGWRPSGPTLRFPDRLPLPLTFSSASSRDQVDLTYGPPQRRPIISESNNQDGESLENQGRKVGLTYIPPQVRFSGQRQRDSYMIDANIQSNQENPTLSFSKVTQNEQKGSRRNPIDIGNSVPQNNLSAPRNQPAPTYAPPSVESNSGQRRNTKTFGNEDGIPQQQVDVQEGSGGRNSQDQENLRYRVLHPNGPNGFNKVESNGERNGIEYQVDLTYGAPQETLVVPPNEPAVTYGPPDEETTTAEPDVTTTELPTGTEGVTEEDDENNSKSNESDEGNIVVRKENLKEDLSDVNQQQSVYYIYHPSGQLQRVVYSAKDNQSAQLKYENIEPIQGPVYTYDPETYVFRRLY